MRRLNQDILILLLSGLVIFETGLLVSVSMELQKKSKDVDTLSDLSRFYADILKRNDVDMSDFDLIALLTIIESRGRRLTDEESTDYD